MQTDQRFGSYRHTPGRTHSKKFFCKMLFRMPGRYLRGVRGLARSCVHVCTHTEVSVYITMCIYRMHTHTHTHTHERSCAVRKHLYLHTYNPHTHTHTHAPDSDTRGHSKRLSCAPRLTHHLKRLMHHLNRCHRY